MIGQAYLLLPFLIQQSVTFNKIQSDKPTFILNFSGSINL